MTPLVCTLIRYAVTIVGSEKNFLLMQLHLPIFHGTRFSIHWQLKLYKVNFAKVSPGGGLRFGGPNFIRKNEN